MKAEDFYVIAVTGQLPTEHSRGLYLNERIGDPVHRGPINEPLLDGRGIRPGPKGRFSGCRKRPRDPELPVA